MAYFHLGYFHHSIGSHKGTWTPCPPFRNSNVTPIFSATYWQVIFSYFAVKRDSKGRRQGLSPGVVTRFDCCVCQTCKLDLLRLQVETLTLQFIACYRVDYKIGASLTRESDTDFWLSLFYNLTGTIRLVTRPLVKTQEKYLPSRDRCAHSTYGLPQQRRYPFRRDRYTKLESYTVIWIRYVYLHLKNLIVIKSA